jgi:hypothetical protein
LARAQTHRSGNHPVKAGYLLYLRRSFPTGHATHAAAPVLNDYIASFNSDQVSDASAVILDHEIGHIGNQLWGVT